MRKGDIKRYLHVFSSFRYSIRYNLTWKQPAFWLAVKCGAYLLDNWFHPTLRIKLKAMSVSWIENHVAPYKETILIFAQLGTYHYSSKGDAEEKST